MIREEDIQSQILNKLLSKPSPFVKESPLFVQGSSKIQEMESILSKCGLEVKCVPSSEVGTCQGIPISGGTIPGTMSNGKGTKYKPLRSGLGREPTLQRNGGFSCAPRVHKSETSLKFKMIEEPEYMKSQ